MKRIPRPKEAEELESGRWLRRYARQVFVSPDAALFLLSGLLVGLLAESSQYSQTIDNGGGSALFALMAIGFAALAVDLTALSIFVSLVNDTYLRVLAISRRGGLSSYLVPYLSAALVSALATMVGAVGGVVYAALPLWMRGALLGLQVGLVVWSAWSVVHIIVDVAIHGLGRYEIARAAQAASMPRIADLIAPDQPSPPESDPNTT
jgi:hypothetical protein